MSSSFWQRVAKDFNQNCWNNVRHAIESDAPKVAISLGAASAILGPEAIPGGFVAGGVLGAVVGIYDGLFSTAWQAVEDAIYYGGSTSIRTGTVTCWETDDAGNWYPITSVDPIILDLNGTGIKTKSMYDGTFFDYKGNGFRQLTGWVTSDEGILVMNPSDGQNVTGKDFLEGGTKLPDGSIAANSFQVLATLDSNHDGKIDSSDPAYSQLRIWIDSNGDGVSNSSELHTLNQLGITSLNLNILIADKTTDFSGNTQLMTGFFTRQDGMPGIMADYQLVTEPTLTIPKILDCVPVNIQQLPYLPEMGTVLDSWQTMVRNANSGLPNLFQLFANQSSPDERSNTLDQILYEWTGSQSKLDVVTKLEGQTPASNSINDEYNNIKEYYYGWLMSQTRLSNLFNSISSSEDSSGNLVADMTTVQKQIQQDLTSNYQQGKQELTEFINAATSIGLGLCDLKDFSNFCEYFINQSDDLAEAVYSAGRNVITNIGVSQILDGVSTVNVTGNSLAGGAGNEILIAGSGNNTLDAGSQGANIIFDAFGPGNDTMSNGGLAGDVIYLWGKGSGNDTILNISSNPDDTIQMGVGITAGSFNWIRNGNDLLLKLKDSGKTLTIQKWFSGTTVGNELKECQISNVQLPMAVLSRQSRLTAK